MIEKIYNTSKKMVKHISVTERLALDAGDCWYEKEIFQGKLNFNKLHQIKPFTLSQEEQDFLNVETENLCQMLDDWKITQIEHDLPIQVWDYMRK